METDAGIHEALLNLFEVDAPRAVKALVFCRDVTALEAEEQLQDALARRKARKLPIITDAVLVMPCECGLFAEVLQGEVLVTTDDVEHGTIACVQRTKGDGRDY